MFNWLTKMVRRVRTRSGGPGSVTTIEPERAIPEPPATEAARTGVRQIDYALLIADSGNLDREVRIDVPQELVRDCQGHLQEWVSGVSLVVFEREEEAGPSNLRLDFVEKLEACGLPGVRCLHGTSLARFDERGGVTLKNFHTLIQHGAALRPGMFVEAGNYRANRMK